MIKSILAATLAAGALLSAPTISRAEEHHEKGMHHELSEADSGGGMGCPMMRGEMKGRMQGGMMHEPQMIEKRLASLKAELNIAQAQTEAWEGYVTAVKARGEAMKANHESIMKAMKDGTAVMRLDAHIVAMEKMLAVLKSLKPATERLYGVLDDGQKKIADKGLGHGCMM